MPELGLHALVEAIYYKGDKRDHIGKRGLFRATHFEDGELMMTPEHGEWPFRWSTPASTLHVMKVIRPGWIGAK